MRSHSSKSAMARCLSAFTALSTALGMLPGFPLPARADEEPQSPPPIMYTVPDEQTPAAVPAAEVQEQEEVQANSRPGEPVNADASPVEPNPPQLAVSKPVTPATSEEQAATPDGAAQAQASTPAKAPVLLKGNVTYLVPRGTPIKLKLASVPTSGLKLGDRDLDGNLLPAQLDQEITARVSDDIYVDDNKVIPEGTVFHGSVTKIHPPRRVGRPGHLEITFDAFKTPDGRKFAFTAQADNYQPSTAKSKAKGFGIIAAHAAGGAVVGALVAYQLFGMSNTIALHGYNIAGGAAAGALAGTANALLRRGKAAVLEPGDDLNMAIDTDLLLPAATDPTPKKPVSELDWAEVEVVKSKIKKDGLEGHYVALELLISNHSHTTLYSMDLYCKDDNGHSFPVSQGFDENDDSMFRIEPHTVKRVNINFMLEFPKLKRTLIWYHHNTRQMILQQRLP